MPQTLLIAEDEQVLRESLAELFRGEGYDVEPVFGASVAEALWLERRPQLAIVELRISGGQGAELCRRLKQHDGGAVLASSALEARADRFGDEATLLDGYRAHARERLVAAWRHEQRGVADTEHLGVTRERAVLLDLEPTAAIDRYADARQQR